MIKKVSFTLLLITICVITISFKENENNEYYSSTEIKEDRLHLVSSEPQEKLEEFCAVDLGNSFIAFKEAIGFKESRGNYFAVNTFGYKGKYQFGGSALRSVGVTNSAMFLYSPEIQEKAFVALLSKHKYLLKDYIEKYSGKVMNGVEITESGILAAAHLGGVGSVKKYLKTNGRNGFRDGYGTSISYYFKKFGGYDTSNIKADIKAKVRL